MDLMQKLTILTEGAKYDAACTSSGSGRHGQPFRAGVGIGNTIAAGCCHSFSADGRCITLLKVLFTNHCIYDCKYCVNRASNDVQRTAFTPQELAELTIEFYRRNYIEGLFLSSGVMKSPDETMERIIQALTLLREKHHFYGYIHAKAIPGASAALVQRLGLLADRLSINIELPSEQSLHRLAPHKTKRAILAPMRQIAEGMVEHTQAMALYRHAPAFAPAGQATQMIIGASPESDYDIIRLAAGLYRGYGMKRVFYSAYIPAVEDSLLPALHTKPPLLREHRLYQADWLMRQYQFDAEEILSADAPNFNPYLDPKCNWAINHMGMFPVDINTAPLQMLLRVPGIGPTSAHRILKVRRTCALRLSDLKKIGVVLKRAQYFICCADHGLGMRADATTTLRALIDPGIYSFGTEQLNMFGPGKTALPGGEDIKTMPAAVEEAVLCLATGL